MSLELGSLLSSASIVVYFGLFCVKNFTNGFGQTWVGDTSNNLFTSSSSEMYLKSVVIRLIKCLQMSVWRHCHLIHQMRIF